jgi:hypothetical protein
MNVKELIARLQEIPWYLDVEVHALDYFVDADGDITGQEPQLDSAPVTDVRQLTTKVILHSE